MVAIRKDNITPKDERSERREEVSSNHLFEHFVQTSNGLIGKYMREHAMVNDIWDKGQLRAVEGVLGTVEQVHNGRSYVTSQKPCSGLL